MHWQFTAEVVEWRGPAPYYYLPLPPDDAADLKDEARGLIYWGQVAVTATIGATTFETALFPKDGTYLLPLKDVVRTAEGLAVGDVAAVRLTLGSSRRPAGEPG
ncbi:DUF1905 domain-containing protein [Xylanimonas protaetiae]|uniref:DUF1905 domain-containing protein n=1 Tax=Xylanimonas protaetiae TaxID=2509457 RepID=A0A4P6F8X1_9MICO|nr:DUF1905 domain-containing protein [Xylanimonas protaetiae]QAY71343.1 DUF1905 domain-containing protein [Xylanimonas protaetiae]